MKSLRSFIFLIAGAALLAVLAHAQAPKKVPFQPTTAISGKALFGQYCAVCHGTDGKGAGPAASALKQRPTDLTQIARQNNGTFPEARFLSMMNGEVETPAHGSTEMPIWGSNFRKTTSSPNLVQDRIHALMNFIEDMQAK